MFVKSRPQAGEVDGESIKIIGDVRGKHVLFVDDIADSAKTLVADAKAAKEAGAKNIYAAVGHALLSGDAVVRLDQSPIDELIVTNTIPHPPDKFKGTRVKITCLSIAALAAEAIRRIHDGESLSELIS
jgi:ribose-phosphate pyrophosphokinase